MKVHPVSVAEPSDFAGPLELPCGKTLARPKIELIWDEQAVGARFEFNSLRDCRKCYEAISGRYVYGLSEGQQLQEGE